MYVALVLCTYKTHVSARLEISDVHLILNFKKTYDMKILNVMNF